MYPSEDVPARPSTPSHRPAKR